MGRLHHLHIITSLKFTLWEENLRYASFAILKGEQINDIWELQNCFLSTMHGKIKKKKSL